MKRLALILAITFLTSVATADETHGWAVIYKRSVVNPNVRTLIYCTTGVDCNVVYMDEEETKWFPTKDKALDFLNGFWIEAGSSSGELSHIDLNGNIVPPTPMDPSRVIGLFECRHLSIHLQKVGVHKVTVQEPKEVEQDIKEWKP